MRFLTTLCLSLASLLTVAQSTYNKLEWKTTPALHTVNSGFANEAATFVLDKKMIEYAIEKDGFFMYKTVHRIIHINNDKGIEMFNKVYLPYNEGLQMMDVKARTVLPGGKVIQFNEKNIKEIKEDDNVYKIFALDGLVKGCEVEYYYTLKTYPSFFGREILSSRIPVMKSHFELVAPEHLIFEAKSYNNLPAAKDTTYGEKRYVRLEAENLAANHEEKYAMFDANLKRVEYKLCYNTAKNAKERLFTWNELAKKAYDIYTIISEKEAKKIKDLVQDAGVKPTMTDKEKIVLLEAFFKKNFINREDISEDDAEDLLKVIKNKVASNRAYCKLYCAAFKEAGVDFQIILTGNRENYGVDKSFENWNNARNFLFYFPTTKKFMAPTEMLYRYPWIPPTWAGTNGLYCVTTTLGSLTTAIAEIKPIPMEAYEHNYLNMEVKAKLDKDGDALLLDVRQLYAGYAAPNYKAVFVLYPADEQQKFLKELVKFGTNSENILTSSFENKELDQNDPYKPFIIKASVRSSQLVERAGEKIIVKVGELIGQQAEMYNTVERTTPVDLEYPHALVRTIELTIPDGYEVKNLKDLNFKEEYRENDKVTMGFVCTYELVQNVLKIRIQEDYTNINYPLQQYTPFMKVINAAADFNGSVLVLEKKG